MKSAPSLVWLGCWISLVLPTSARGDEDLDFNRDIRPILSANCFACHGPDAKHAEADLRLDLREIAVKENGEGHAAIVPGNPDASVLIHRIRSADDDVRMPPADSNKQLTEVQKELLARWISGGAEYKPHWALVRPVRPPVPASDYQNPIDAFIAARLAKKGLASAPEADRSTLIRRVTLDLTGLPPTPEEVDAFVNDASDNAYERNVDRLLASPRYAERMTMNWLDLARYADTHGYNNDGERTQWPWRDWVLNAFHTNMPYDQFVVDQLAGDLRENVTPQQRLATGFGRNHVITSEGGIIEEEYRVEYVADRVHTTATVFLGLSMQCARCHDHKFDPITQKDYYRFFAFFNNVPEGVLAYGGEIVAAKPFIQVPSPFQLGPVEELDREAAALAARLKQRETQIEEPLARWVSEAKDLKPMPPDVAGLVARFSLDEASGTTIFDALDSNRAGVIVGNSKWSDDKLRKSLEFDGQTYVELGQLTEFERDQPFSISVWVYPTSTEPITVVSKMDDPNANRGFDLIIEQGKPAVHLVHRWPDNGMKVIAKNSLSLNAWHHLLATYDGSSHAAGVTIHIDGEAAPLDVVADTLTETVATDKPVHLGRRSGSVPFLGRIDELQFYSTRLTAHDAAQLADEMLASASRIVAIPAAARTAAQQAQLRRYYLERIDEPYRKILTEMEDLGRRRTELEKSFKQTMVMEELPTPRQTFVLNRGEYDQPGEPVAAAVPSSLPPLPNGATANRLGLAQWIVDPTNPLTARVTVNRWWQNYFGRGIVATSEDFGSQGAWPTHPELLDWLATELISRGWNVKAMQKLIVMSATYRQSSRVTPELLERDPENHLLARGPRFRLPAETMRDNALAISGLLVERLGGPSVYPYQPAGLWADVSVERRNTYKQEQGENLYRRGMYTFWKRTCPPPALSTFDAPDRETCMIRRAITNTPLQALVLMNDPTYVEAARKLAERVILKGGETPKTRLDYAFRLAVARSALPEEQQLLLPLVEEANQRFQAAPQKAEELLAIGQSPRAGEIAPAELAAWTTVASIILNLDETISKQ